MDRYPPPTVWRQVDLAGRRADELLATGRELDFGRDAAGRLRIALVERSGPARKVSVLEALAVAAGAPI